MKAFSNLIITRQYAFRSSIRNSFSIRTFKKGLSSNANAVVKEIPKRFNEAGVEMLPEWLYEKVFPDISSNIPVHNGSVEIALKHLEDQGLKGKEAENFLNVPEFDIPTLCGNSIAEHFWNIGEQKSKKYRELAMEFVDSNLLNMPSDKDLLIKPGWTRFESNKEPESVEFPREKVLCFDVETLLSSSNYGIIACAASSCAWYTWISPRLIEFKEKKLGERFKKNDIEINDISDQNNQNSANDESIIEKDNKKKPTARKKKGDKGLKSSKQENGVDNFKVQEIGSLIPMGKDKIIIGHNVSFDRARIKEEYHYKSSGNKFIDTMALHIAVSGLCRQQRPTWAKYKKAEENGDVYSVNNEKDFQSIYEVSSMNNLHDVYNLHCKKKIDKSISKKLFIDGTLEEIVIEENLRRSLIYCANDVLATFEVFTKVLPRFLKLCPHPVSFAGMLEMGNMFLTTSKDWDDYVQNAEKVYQHQRDAVETSLQQLAYDAVELGKKDPDLIKKDPWLSQLDWSFPSSRAKKLPGYPNWYRNIYCNKTSKVKITPKSRIAPLLLRLKWQDFPLYYSRKYGWMYRVPRDVEHQTTAEECNFSQDDLSDNEVEANEEKKGPSKKKSNTKSEDDIKEIDELFVNDINGRYYRIPHKDGLEAKCLLPLAKHYMVLFEKGVLSSEHEVAKDALTMNANCSYWISARERIRKQMVIYEDHPNIMDNMGFESDKEKKIGMILPQTVTMGTITRRAVENTWMTASNAKKDRIGSELKAIIQAPKGYKIIGADVDSEELWIASLIGDSQFGFHGSTAMGWMTLQGDKAAGTDQHSRTANILKISRSDAKVFNYGRIYGAGLKFAVQLLKQFNETMGDSQAKERATDLYNHTKGKKFYGKGKIKAPYENFWYGGSESYMFNRLEEIATDNNPQTPALKCGITEALKGCIVNKNYMTSRVNWVVQSSGVDYLHLLLVSMQYLMEKYKIEGRFMLSVHDEVRFLVKETDSYRAALALQISNFWTRAMFSYMLGINDLPMSVAFFSAVDIDHVLRKEAESSCRTISYDTEIEDGKSLTIHELLKHKSSLLPPDENNQNNGNDYSELDNDQDNYNKNASYLLTPCKTAKDKEYLTIQGLSNEKDVEKLILKIHPSFSRLKLKNGQGVNIVNSIL
ncbi:11384_t:CDS:2 [Funneliformis geosporum]|nr:11384_t:CDS:2 [Funneliformis geosporum]